MASAKNTWGDESPVSQTCAANATARPAENCPYCGAELKQVGGEGAFAAYQCGSVFWDDRQWVAGCQCLGTECDALRALRAQLAARDEDAQIGADVRRLLEEGR